MVFLVGDGEYDSANTMSLIADRFRTELHSNVEYLIANPTQDMPDYPESSFGNLEALDRADLAVIYTRFRRLPDAEMDAISRYLDRSGRFIGLRTSSHAFRFGAESRWASWNHFGATVLGTPWVSHSGRETTTEVRHASEVDGHPILAGVPGSFGVRSWLYQTQPSQDCSVLLTGRCINEHGSPQGAAEALAWTRETGRQRVFFTTLGHPEDIALTVTQRLLLNAASWALN